MPRETDERERQAALPQPAPPSPYGGGTARLQQVSLAERLADELRERILDGRLLDGSVLPKQDEIVEQFGVSKPSAREAFRILETEGLITVRRGSIGGSVVHVPGTASVAYMLALLLRAGSAGLDDVARALREMEPACAALCAARPDRDRSVLPDLRREHQLMAEAIESGDAEAAVSASRAFHEILVATCGNQTMIALCGALEALWSAHEEAWADDAVRRGHFPPIPLRRKALDEHEQLIELIAQGDADGVAKTARQHLETAQLYPLGSGQDRPVDARLLRGHRPGSPA
ncbi:MAG: GntR family transcriptional regulator [Actinomycetia bacterium]|nr:GntR family transcriptional regulator [Actinomycetes bacterium]